MYVEAQDVKDWLQSLDPDTVVYGNGGSTHSCVITTYAKTVNPAVVFTAPDLEYKHKKGHIYGPTTAQEIGSTSARVANYMDLFDRAKEFDAVMTAKEALEILEQEGI